MSPQAGVVLTQEIAPRLRTVVAHIQPVGCEDAEELYQDGLAMAAKMLDQLERRGKAVTPGNVAYYVTLHLRSGRRSHGAGRSDAMASTTQLDQHSSVLSFEEEVGYDPELDEAIRLGDLLASSKEDPAMAAARNLDWEEFLQSHDYRFGPILAAQAKGEKMEPVARAFGCSLSSVSSLRRRLAAELREAFGEDLLESAVQQQRPCWMSSLAVERERFACRAERRPRRSSRQVE